MAYCSGCWKSDSRIRSAIARVIGLSCTLGHMSLHMWRHMWSDMCPGVKAPERRWNKSTINYTVDGERAGGHVAANRARKLGVVHLLLHVPYLQYTPFVSAKYLVQSRSVLQNSNSQLYNNISMLFLFPVKDGKLSTGVNATFNASCYS